METTLKFTVFKKLSSALRPFESPQFRKALRAHCLVEFAVQQQAGPHFPSLLAQ